MSPGHLHDMQNGKSDQFVTFEDEVDYHCHYFFYIILVIQCRAIIHALVVMAAIIKIRIKMSSIMLHFLFFMIINEA